MSIVNPGLILPLKPGVAKLGFAAEEASDFQLGLRVIPVGLEYGSRTRVGSGLTIRYGRPLFFRDYADLHREEKDAAVKKLMADLTVEMIMNFPHFRDAGQLALARKFVALGLAPSKFSVSQLFLRKENDPAFWEGLTTRLKAFDEANKESHIPVPAWGYRRAWKELGPARRARQLVFLLGTLQLAVLDLFNSSVPELCVQSLVEQIAVDETEKMSLRLMISPVVLAALYGLQFWLLKLLFPVYLGGAGFGTYFVYTVASFFLWYFGLHWRRRFKRVASVFLFRKAGVDRSSQVVTCYKALGQYLGDLEDHGR
jgi:hypothetical protein